MRQRTIKNIVSVSGIGLHSGQRCTVRLVPEPRNKGILFYLNMNAFKMFEYNAQNICNTMLATSVGSSDCFVSTVEHLMACIHVLHITNIGISIDGPELPILDGSAYNFYSLLEAAEIEEQDAETQVMNLKDFEFIKDSEHFIICKECTRLPRISCNNVSNLSIKYEWYNPIQDKLDIPYK